MFTLRGKSEIQTQAKCGKVSNWYRFSSLFTKRSTVSILMPPTALKSYPKTPVKGLWLSLKHAEQQGLFKG